MQNFHFLDLLIDETSLLRKHFTMSVKNTVQISKHDWEKRMASYVTSRNIGK